MDNSFPLVFGPDVKVLLFSSPLSFILFHDPKNPRQELLQLEEHVAGRCCRTGGVKDAEVSQHETWGPSVDALWSYFAVSFEICS